ncbi:MAG: 2-C-methyl-D-erythritol 4-phosphate cytidylyltransferase [Bacilli bacterium]|nr:2-C-methyl-D-erythritol 4-phosphate cytidylyltransferase [Bacilli bacterium]MBO6195535.1 2-C-methyl-D-erythritol 4-phosphate cytidylyltransferase [Bacilli bacterium]
MNYAILLAGGKGTRMGNVGVPKQFLMINNKPIIIYTLEKLLSIKQIDKVIIVCNEGYCAYMTDLLTDYNLSKNVYITVGGTNRLESTLNGIEYIDKNFGVNENDIFIAHDAVRPFTEDRIFEENIKYAKEYNAATTVFDLIETISEVNEEGMIYKLYPRKNLYTGQSPQTFNIKYFLEMTENIPKDKYDVFTDLAENITYNGGLVYPVKGDKNNIKITTPKDLYLAEEFINTK